MAEGEHRSLIGSFPEALFIASLTAGAYWIAFSYEASYLDAFGFPSHLVDIGLHTMLWAAVALSAPLWVLFLYMNVVSMFWPKEPAIQSAVGMLLTSLIFPLWFVSIYGVRKEDWALHLTFLGIIAFVVTIELVLPAFTYPDQPSFREKLIVAHTHGLAARAEQKDIVRRLFDAVGPTPVVLVFIFAIGGVLAHFAGNAKAQTQKDYLVFADSPYIAVVRIYHDTILAVPFDRKTKVVLPQVIIQKIEKESIKLTLDKDVGPLKPANVKWF